MSADLDALLKRIWLRHHADALDRVACVERAAAALARGSADREELARARSAAHKLAGALGVFGSPEGSAYASRIESLLADDPDPDPALVARLAGQLRASVPAPQTS